MVDCTNKNIWYKKRSKKSFKLFFLIFLLIIIFLCSLLYYDRVICKQIFKICADYANSCAAECVNSAVLISLDETVSYNDLIYVENNSNDEIVLISTNSYKVNKINRDVVNTTSKLLKNKMAQGIPIPLLAFSGISFFVGYGKIINLKTINNISVTCDFSSSFESVGINQTLHSIYLEVESILDIEVPLNNKREICKSKILISESVLVGKVPEIYLNGVIN